MITEGRIKEIVANYSGKEEKNIKRETSLIDDLELDSLDVVELTMIFEEEMGIKIPPEDTYKLETVGELISYLKRK